MGSIPEEVIVPHFVGGGRIEKTSKSVQAPGQGQLVIKVEANALCGSERSQFFNGSPDITPGHEAAGIVVSSGPRTSTSVGTRGAVFLMDFCGMCRSCLKGFTNQCLNKRADMGFSHDGGYGVYELIHENIFFPVDSSLSGTDTTLLLDIMGTGGHSIRRAQRAHSDITSLIVAGAGPIGLGVLAMAKIMLGFDLPVYIYDVVDYRLALAEDLGGIAISLAGGKTLSNGLKHHGVSQIDVAIDTSGKKAARESSLHSLAQRGVLVLVGHGEELLLNVSPNMIATERTVLGSEYFAYSELAVNYKYLAQNHDYIAKIITHRFGVEDIQHAFDLFFSGKCGKVIIEQ
jgi:threonine dehydrogenase-like Zn-dependent dehydrogenase